MAATPICCFSLQLLTDAQRSVFALTEAQNSSLGSNLAQPLVLVVSGGEDSVGRGERGLNDHTKLVARTPSPLSLWGLKVNATTLMQTPLVNSPPSPHHHQPHPLRVSCQIFVRFICHRVIIASNLP